MGRLDGKVCLITGGARGQGAAEAARFVEEGATVYITDFLVEAGEETAKATGASSSTTTSPTRGAGRRWSTQIVGHAGRLDVLVNNAGIFRKVPLIETTVELWDRIISVNQTGVFLGMHAAAPPMIEQGSGSIVNISSIAGLEGTAGVRLRRHQVGGAGHDQVRRRRARPPRDPGQLDPPRDHRHRHDRRAPLEEAAQTVPLKKNGTPEDVAELALWLASDESRYTSGAEITVDGGLTA